MPLKRERWGFSAFSSHWKKRKGLTTSAVSNGLSQEHFEACTWMWARFLPMKGPAVAFPIFPVFDAVGGLALRGFGSLEESRQGVWRHGLWLHVLTMNWFGTMPPEGLAIRLVFSNLLPYPVGPRPTAHEYVPHLHIPVSPRRSPSLFGVATYMGLSFGSHAFSLPSSALGKGSFQ